MPRSLPSEPLGTLSQVIEYYDAAGQMQVMVHQYLRPDGSIGASGRPDPKWLRHEGEILYA